MDEPNKVSFQLYDEDGNGPVGEVEFIDDGVNVIKFKGKFYLMSYCDENGYDAFVEARFYDADLDEPPWRSVSKRPQWLLDYWNKPQS